jgi:anti-sigma B factor antagonist
MTTIHLTTSVRKASEGVAVVDIRGALSGFTESILTDTFNHACEVSSRVVVLNFAGLDYLNSSGIGVLFTLLVRAQRQKCRLLACGLSEQYRQILDLTRLSEGIDIYASENAALASVR